MMTAKMMEALKNAGIAKEWHKGDMHRLYIELSVACEMYYDNNDHFEHGNIAVNRYEKNNGKVWVDMETGEVHTKGISDGEEVISQIMELVAYLMPEETKEETTVENTETVEAEGTEECIRIWYAVLRDSEDNDHSTGSFDRDEAIRMARQYRAEGDTEAYIALIDPKDDYCIDEMRAF